MKDILIEENEKKLKAILNTEDCKYNGSDRYLVRYRYQVDVNGNTTWLYKDKIFDQDGNLIPLENEYNSIFLFTKGLAVVCIYSNLEFRKIDGNLKMFKESKYGLIDVNGKELLPCIYQSISIKSEGFLELSKDGQMQAVPISEVVNGEFNWDDAI